MIIRIIRKHIIIIYIDSWHDDMYIFPHRNITHRYTVSIDNYYFFIHRYSHHFPPKAARLQEGSNTLTYHAYFNGTDYEPQPGGLEDDLGFPAEIHLASVLTFYSEEGYHGAGDESSNAFFV